MSHTELGRAHSQILWTLYLIPFFELGFAEYSISLLRAIEDCCRRMSIDEGDFTACSCLGHRSIDDRCGIYVASTTMPSSRFAPVYAVSSPAFAAKAAGAFLFVGLKQDDCCSRFAVGFTVADYLDCRSLAGKVD